MCFILEQLLQYKGPESDNPGLTNLREEIRYHSRTTRDVSQSSSPENMTRNGTVSPSSAPGNTTETIRVSFTYYDRMMREAKKSDRLSLLNVLYFFTRIYLCQQRVQFSIAGSNGALHMTRKIN